MYPSARLVIVALTLAAGGCGIFDAETEAVRHQSLLPPIRASAEAIQLEFLFVERPLGDPQLERKLWDEIDQVATLDGRVRAAARRNGLRVGVVGAHPPRQLQELLREPKIAAPATDPNQQHGPQSRRVFVQPGRETHIVTSPLYESCSISTHVDGVVHLSEFRHARCVFRLTAQRTSDDWIELDFIPEIQHGANKLRHDAGPTGWRLVTSQKRKSFHDARFNIPLAVGEMVVIGLDPRRPGSLGDYFFAGPQAEDEDQKERLLVVRFIGMQRAQTLDP